jgi:hypothetical protein
LRRRVELVMLCMPCTTSTSKYLTSCSLHFGLVCTLLCVSYNIYIFPCRHTKNSFIKTSLVHTLYRVQKYGVLPLDKFYEHLSTSEMTQCQQSH